LNQANFERDIFPRKSLSKLTPMNEFEKAVVFLHHFVTFFSISRLFFLFYLLLKTFCRFFLNFLTFFNPPALILAQKQRCLKTLHTKPPPFLTQKQALLISTTCACAGGHKK
jgi:hypothetical protein